MTNLSTLSSLKDQLTLLNIVIKQPVRLTLQLDWKIYKTTVACIHNL